MPLIEVGEVRRVYASGRREVEALRGVTFNVEAGEFVSIMGPSGSGKSTLMNLMGCLDRPSEGESRISGHSVSALNTAHLADLRGGEIGFVFQTFNLILTLDSDTSESIMRLLQDINQDTGVTIIQVPHDEYMARCARRIIRLRDGLIQQVEQLEPGASNQSDGRFQEDIC